MNLTLDIARRAADVEWDDLPTDARHVARLSLADGLAVMIGAIGHEPAVEPFAKQARSYGPGPSTLLAGGTAPVPAAALANGALSHALDFEDTFDRAGLHVNAAVTPAVLALAEAEGKSLGAALNAMTLGADLACRIGLTLRNDPADRGWYHPPMIGAIAAAFAGARLLGLSPEASEAALSLAQVQFSLTGALKRSPASDLRAIRDGFAARAATEAVLLARAGVTGAIDPLGAEGGIVEMLTGALPDPTPFEGFCDAFLTPEISLKIWPCCRGTHPAIALALELRDEGIVPDDLQAIAFTIEPPDGMLFEPRADRIRPLTATSAKFSIPFCFASTLRHGQPGLGSFAPDARSDSATLAVAERATLRTCARGAGRTAHITFSNGKQIDRPLPDPPVMRAGDTPFTALIPKLLDCLGQSETAQNTLLSLETSDPSMPVATLMASLDPTRNT